MSRSGYEMVRYADDFVIRCSTEEKAKKALIEIKKKAEEIELTLHPEKTRIVDTTQKIEFDFLGYNFDRNTKWPRNKRMQCIVDDHNQSLKGWFEYFRHSNRKTFQMTDISICKRLRSILRKRHGRHGRARGTDHWRWPNAFFSGLGLFALTAAHEQARQSRCGNY